MEATILEYNAVQALYIAYYGRPADPEGLAFWAMEAASAGGVARVAAAFGTSEEFADNFSGLDNTLLVNKLYQQLFGRAADEAGFDFYSNRLADGAFTPVDVALRLVDGIDPGTDDARIFANRTMVANYVTTLRPGIANRDTILDTVDQSAGSVDNALEQIGITAEERAQFDRSFGGEVVNGVLVGDLSGESAPYFTAETVLESITVEGAVAAGFDDDDAVAFTLGTEGTLTFALTVAEADARVDLSVTGQGTGFPVANFSAAPGTTSIFSLPVAFRDALVVELQAEQGATDYELLIDPPGTVGRPEVINGVDWLDAGNTPAAATGLWLDGSGDARVSGGTGYRDDQADYFTFVAPESGQARLSLTGLTDDLDLFLLTAAGDVLRAPRLSGSSSESVVYQIDGETDYIVAVRPFQDATSDYQLTLDLPASLPPVGTLDTVNGVTIFDAPESGSAAVMLTAAEKLMIDGSVAAGGDNADNYRFVAPQNGIVDVELYGLQPGANADLRVTDDSGTFEILSAAGGDEAEGVRFAAEAGEGYTLSVLGVAGATGYFLEADYLG